MDDRRFVIGGPLRLGAALVLAVVAGALATLARRLDWGVAWIAIVPAVCLVVPAFGLARRIALARDADELVVETGWLVRRAWRIPLRGIELEVVPTAGLRAVVAHRDQRQFPLAVWVGRRKAERLAAWLDAAAPGGAWPRRAAPRPRGDR